MKKHFTLFLLLTLGICLFAVSESTALPREDSYRKTATAGLFKSEYDRLSENPAYVGAKLNFIDFTNSATKEKTNIFSTMDGLNTDNRFLLGGITNLGFGGIGGFVELGYQKNPDQISLSRNYGNTSVDLTTYEGTSEDSDVYLAESGGSYSSKETLFAKDERYTEDDHLNAHLAVGGINAGPVILGFSFSRDTDNLDGSSTGITTGEGSFSYTKTRLTDGFTEYSRSGAYNNERKVEPVNYFFTMGMLMPMGGILEDLECQLYANYLQYSMTEDNSGSENMSYPGGYSISYNGNWYDTDRIVKDEEKRDGFQYGIRLETREKILGWSAETYLKWLNGGLTPNKERTTIYRDGSDNYSYSYSGNSSHLNSRIEEGKVTYSGDGISQNEYEAGIMLRKALSKDMLFGWGLVYNLKISENKYSKTTSYRRVDTVDDGDGVAESTDYTRTRTGSYTDEITDSEMTNTFTIPIGFEYRATPTLSWRIGVIHITQIKTTESKSERKSTSDLYDDYDRADIAGNETNDDAIAGSTVSSTIGGYTFDTTARNSREYQSENIQNNLFYFGIGYTIDMKVQVDVLLQSAYTTDYNRFSTGSVYLSATYLMQ